MNDNIKKLLNLLHVMMPGKSDEEIIENALLLLCVRFCTFLKDRTTIEGDLNENPN